MDINKLKQSVSKIDPKDTKALAAALKAIESLANLLNILALDSELDQLNQDIEDATGVKKEKMPLDDALEALAEITTNKTENGKKVFLLHRLTEDLEFSNSATEDRKFKTDKPTEWIVEFAEADKKQDVSEVGKSGANPMVSAWIPSDAIDSIPGAAPNSGVWGDMGKNPHVSSFKIIVKPGTYEIYQELRE